MALDGTEKIGQAIVFVVAARSGQENHPFGEVPERGPNLVAIDDPLVAAARCEGLLVGHVGPSAGFTETLAPDLLRREGAGNEFPLLFFGAMFQNGRHHHGETDDVDHEGSARIGERTVRD